MYSVVIRYLLEHAPIALLCGLLLGLSSVSCRPILSDFNRAEKMEITSQVWLHRTSRNIVSITDKDGMGLVYGNVLRIGYESGSRKRLVVTYKPFPSSTQSTNDNNDSGLKVARIDLESMQVTSVPDSDGAISKSLQIIEIFFP